MLFLSIFIIPDDCAVTFFNVGAVNIVTVFLHYLLQDLKPILVKDLKQSLPLSINAVLVAAFRCQPQIGDA